MKTPKKTSPLGGLLNFAAVVIVTSLIALATGCSKKPDAPIVEPRDLGNIELHAPGTFSMDLGERKELTMKASEATNDDFVINITVTVRSFSGVVDGELTKSTNLKAHSGQKCVTRLGDTALEFTPVLKAD